MYLLCVKCCFFLDKKVQLFHFFVTLNTYILFAHGVLKNKECSLNKSQMQIGVFVSVKLQITPGFVFVQML